LRPFRTNLGHLPAVLPAWRLYSLCHSNPPLVLQKRPASNRMCRTYSPLLDIDRTPEWLSNSAVGVIITVAREADSIALPRFGGGDVKQPTRQDQVARMEAQHEKQRHAAQTGKEHSPAETPRVLARTSFLDVSALTARQGLWTRLLLQAKRHLLLSY
jgi:hypothetical protein